MFKTEERTIDGYVYKVTQLDALRGRKTLVRLMKVGGDLEKLPDRMTEADVDWICDLFAKQTVVSGGDLQEGAEPVLEKIFATHFAGRYGSMVKWLAFCFAVNFRDFFAGMGEAVKTAVAANASISPKEPIGGSGGS